MVDPPSSLAGDPHSDPNESRLVGEAIRYLFAFSEAMFDLVPDGLVVLDDRLVVRAANTSFAQMLGLGTPDEAKGRSIADHPWLAGRVAVDNTSFVFADLLRDALQTGTPIAVEGVPAPPDTDSPLLAVRAIPWDTHDPRSSRVLLWVGPGQTEVARPRCRPRTSPRRFSRKRTIASSS